MRILPVVLLVAATACGKGKPTNQDQPKPGSGCNVVTSAPPENTQAPDVTLPAATGTPPNKDKAVGAETLKKLADMKFPGFDLKPMELSDKAMIVRQTTATSPKISATMLIRPCSETVICLPMEAEKWKADEKFTTHILGALKDAKDTVMEIGSTDFNGVTMISWYVLGQSFGKDAVGNSPGAFKYAYGLNWNDGVNMIQVAAGYSDMPLKTKELMVAAIPRSDLEKTARAFMDAYTHAW